MKPILVSTIYSAVCLLCLLQIGNAWGQATEDELRELPMTTTKAYKETKHFDFTGDYLYALARDYAVFPEDVGADQFVFYRYTGILGKSINVWPRFVSSVPAPSSEGDACAHTHLSYGVWIKYETTFLWYQSSNYNLVSGGSMSGVRDNQGNCIHKVDNPLKAIDERFGWGTEFSSFVPKKASFFFLGSTVPKEVIVGASAPTHGWGTCYTKGFKACFEPVRVNVWTLPPWTSE